MADAYVYDAVRTAARGKKDGSLHEVPPSASRRRRWNRAAIATA